MASKQHHDIGYQKRKKAKLVMLAAAERRFARKQRRFAQPLSDFMQDWLRYNRYRPYPGPLHHKDDT